LFVLLWAAFVFYSNMQAVFNRLWRVRLRSRIPWGQIARIRTGGFAIMLLPVVLLTVAALVASIASRLDFLLDDYAVLGRFAGGVVAVVRSPVGVFALAWPSFAVLYTFLADVRVPWRIAAVAAGEVAAGWTLGTWLFGEYLAWSSGGSAYGAASAVFVLLIWLNYSARLVLLGCKLTKTWTQEVHGSVEPLPHAVVVRIDLETTE
jgi:membrane protein